MPQSTQSFVPTMDLNGFILIIFLPLIASQCMDYVGMKSCSPAFHYDAIAKDLLECMNDCLVKPGSVCRVIQWKPKTRLCHVDTSSTIYRIRGKCATFTKTPCNNIPDGEAFEVDSGNIFKGGQQMTIVGSLEECKVVCAIGSTCLAFTWLSERRLCINHRQSRDRSTNKLGQGDYQVIKRGLRRTGRCVVLNAGGNSAQGGKEQNVVSLEMCVEAVLNTSSIERVDWNLGNRECWSHKYKGQTYFHPADHLFQLQKHYGCRLWQGTVSLTKLGSTKMSGGLALKGLSEKECVQLCQLVSNCAAVGWSGRWGGCTFHHLELPTEEDPSTTLYTTGGADITTSTTTVSTSTASTTMSTSTEATTTASAGNTGTFVEAFFVRRDNNQLTSRSNRRASLECAMLCFRSNCNNFTSSILNDNHDCGMSGSQAPGRFPIKRFEWIKL